MSLQKNSILAESTPTQKPFDFDTAARNFMQEFGDKRKKLAQKISQPVEPKVPQKIFSKPLKKSVEKKNFSELLSYSPEVLNADLVRITCSLAKALQLSQLPQNLTLYGRTVIFKISPAKKFSNHHNLLSDGTAKIWDKIGAVAHKTGAGWVEKNFIKYPKYKKVPTYTTQSGRELMYIGKMMTDTQVSHSGVKTLARSMNAAFCVGKNGAIFQLFDDPRHGMGGNNSKIINKYLLGKKTTDPAGYNLNGKFIAVEYASREKFLKDSTGNIIRGETEDFTKPQSLSGKKLQKYLAQKIFSTPTPLFLSSNHFVPAGSGGHGDGLSREDKNTLSITAPPQNFAYSLMSNQRVLV